MRGRPVVYDITRLITRIFNRTPNGIDRVDFAMANYFLDPERDDRTGLVITGLGPRVLAPRAAREAIDNIREHWGEDDEPDTGEVIAALGGAPTTAARISKRRRGQYRDALAWIGRHGIPLRRSPRDFLAHGGVYLNVSQFPLWIEGCFRWLDGRTGIDGYFFVHDLLPLETPEYFRPEECLRHARRLATVARFGQGAIVSTSLVRDSLQRHLEAIGRPSMPILVAPLPVEPIFARRESIAAPIVSGPYFVMCGTIEPRKNHLLVLHIWRDLVAEFGEAAPKLVLIGAPGWENEHVIDLLDRCPGLQRHVIEVSGLPTPSVKRLLAGARALLAPSFAEGYGLPIVEALSARVPVIASDIPVFHEIGAGRIMAIDPTDGPRWRAAICAFACEGSAARRAALAALADYAAPDWPSYFGKIEDFIREAR
ncbi:MAG TPA: glycosyltransferase [Roseiarcus sp.]|jgi:glycosyltransferase involved in cell wall biosynthesis